MKIGAILLSLAVTLPALASTYTGVKSSSPEGYRARGILMYENKNYVGAIDQLSHLYMMEDGKKYVEDADFYIALSNYERGDAYCVEMFKKFIANYPASIRVPYAWAKIGDCYFFNGKYGEALTAYAQIVPSAFNNDYKLDLTYRSAYSMLKLGEFDRAKELFAKLSHTSRYRNAGLFYDAYIDYAGKDFGAAKEKFRLLPPSSELGRASQYYLCQIYFVEGDYDNVISLGKRLLEPAGDDSEYGREMNRVIGESYYHTGDDDNAGRYLSRYMESPGAEPVRSSLYIMGVLHYRNAEWQDAADCFGRVTGEDDELAQSAYLYLGQAYVKTGNMNGAAIAFEKALNMPYNSDIQETAFYNYAVSQNEGGRTPFNRSIDIFETFLNRFPDSRYADEVEDYMINAYLTGNDYNRALESISRISSPSRKVLAAKQNVLFQLGVQALSNDDTGRAADYFGQARAVGRYDAKVLNNCNLWLAECQYREGNYKAAEQSWAAFVANAGKEDAANVALARYNMGYARFQQRNYTGARAAFNEAAADDALSASLRSDALNRIGDTYYYARDYATAEDYYEQAYVGDNSTGDYSLFQKSMMLGLQRDYKGKINMLDQLLRQYPKSPLCPSALLQKAESYVNLGNNASAINTYKLLISQYPNSADARKGLLQLAITERNAGNADKAEEAYKNTIKLYPTSEEAAVAAEDLKVMYADSGRLDEYVAFVKTVPNAPQIDVNDLDRLAYEAAEKAYLEQKGTGKLENYIKEYPNGAYVSRAKYYVAISMYEKGNLDDALEMVDEVIATSADAGFGVDALRIKGEILMKQAKAADALVVYRTMAQKASTQDAVINANLGVMRASLMTNKFAEMRDAADRLLKSGGLSSTEEKEARYCRATANIKLGSGQAAESDLKLLARDPRNEYGAQAAYDLANYYYNAGDNVAAEETLNNFIEAGTPHQYWLARGFILLADVYHKKGRNIEAVQYLRSLKENYPGSESDIFEMINSRLDEWAVAGGDAK